MTVIWWHSVYSYSIHYDYCYSLITFGIIDIIQWWYCWRWRDKYSIIDRYCDIQYLFNLRFIQHSVGTYCCVEIDVALYWHYHLVKLTYSDIHYSVFILLTCHSGIVFIEKFIRVFELFVICIQWPMISVFNDVNTVFSRKSMTIQAYCAR